MTQLTHAEQTAIVDNAVATLEPVTTLEPGIYHNISMDDYNALPYFRASGAKDMAVSISEYWKKHIDPEREQRKTDATEFGTALHSFLLEPHLFAAEYVIKPDDMKFTTKEGKAWRADKEAEGFYIITGDNMRHIEKIYRNAALTGALEYLKGGQAEVTFIWDEHTPHGDVRCKARFDYLRDDYAIDIKSFSNAQSKPIDRCVALASANYGYHVSAAFYTNGLTALNRAAQMGYLFLDSGLAPHAELRVHAPKCNGMVNEYWGITQDFIARSLSLHAHCMQKFGLSPWYDKIHPKTFNDTDFPSYMTEAMV